MGFKEVGEENIATGDFKPSKNNSISQEQKDQEKNQVKTDSLNDKESENIDEKPESASEREGEKQVTDDSGYVNPLFQYNENKVESSDNVSIENKEDDKVDLEKILLEKTGGKFKSLDEILSLTERKVEEKPKNEYVAKLEEFIENGGSPETFVKVNSIDLDKMSSEDKIKMQLELQNPHLGREDIEFMFEEDFAKPNLSDYDGDEEDEQYQKKLKAYNIRLKKALPQADEFIGRWKAESLEVKPIENSNNQAEFQAVFEQGLTEATRDLSEITLPVGANDSFTFKIGNSERDMVLNKKKSFDAMLQRYAKDGSFDFKSYAKDQIVLENLQHILHLARAEERALVQEQMIKEVKRPDYSSQRSANPRDNSGKFKPLHQQAKEQGY